MTSLRSLLVASLTTAFVAAAAPAAHAETWRHSDAPRDVLARESASTDVRVDDRVARADLTHLTVRFGADALRVASSIREVGCVHRWDLRVVTSRGDVYRLTRDTSPYDGCRAAVRLTRNGSAHACRGLRVNPTRSGILATVPRECLGSPYRVRIGVQDQDLVGSDEKPTHFYDDALRTGRYTEGRPRLSPWITGG